MIVALSAGLGYLLLLGFVFFRRSGRNPAERWLLLYLAYSVVLMGLHALVLNNLPGGSLGLPIQVLTMGGFVVSVILTGVLTLSYLVLPARMLLTWVVLSGIWTVGVIVSALAGAPSLLGAQADLLPFNTEITLSLEILFFGWLALGVFLFGLIARAFLSEPLPLYANRILFWYIVIPFLMLGDAFVGWLASPWNEVGFVVRLIGAAAASYAVTSHRIFDLRDSARRFISFIILTAATAALVFGGIYATLSLISGSADQNTIWLIVLVVALLVALLLQPVRQVLLWFLRNLVERDKADIAEAVRRYSQRVGALLDLNELAVTASKTADELLSARRGCLILATEENDVVTLEIAGADRAEHIRMGRVAASGPIYQQLMLGSPLLQYDIDYQKEYRAAPQAERGYFSALHMDIYAPIVQDKKLLGILALGPKLNDDPYRPREIELIAALANQTVTALENARLVTDLRSLNAAISTLNENLRESNERLERLDNVKSDFISIASHELRTPLTQIQGYADLLLEMSERNLLTPEQTVEITSSLRQASQRMGEVISSMLDVSQIDVENMDLSFVETSLASIIKLAIEPYSDAIQTRNLALVARGLRNLPPVYGDYKRLVQAFEALITNAIKFTPDGGKINVSGEIYEKDVMGEPKSVRITVEDTGIGIDKEHLELIFEKFYRVGPTSLHSTGSTKFKGAGPGLGLPIAKGIIVGHGGRIWVESEGCDEEKLPGSKFHVVLPVYPAMKEARERIKEMRETLHSAEDSLTNMGK